MGVNSSSNSQLYYLISIPGWLRLTNLILGLLCIIFTSIGFEDDFESDGGIWTPYLNYYGLGYKEERANVLSLIIICSCFVISTIFLLLLIIVDDAVIKWRAWNRFLNLSLAFLLFTGWLSGLLGFLLFRQGCCRVDILSSERIKHELEGYTLPCLCLINPKNDPDESYPVLNGLTGFEFVEFVKAQPHHANGHFANLILLLLNVAVYFGAVWKVD